MANPTGINQYTKFGASRVNAAKKVKYNKILRSNAQRGLAEARKPSPFAVGIKGPKVGLNERFYQGQVKALTPKYRRAK